MCYQIFFEERALPRRTRDIDAEKKHLSNQDTPKCFYRRVGLEEADRGELYPIWSAGFDTFAHFGIGIGIYFSQLLFLLGVTFVGAMIMTLADNAYQGEYNRDDPQRASYRSTAACNSYVNVTATVGCDNNATSCLALYTYDCDLPYRAAVADLAMSVVFAAAVFMSALMEARIIRTLDEAIQTASDYSIEVRDPPGDADNPDEWQAYFSRYGIVRYVTVMRANGEMLEAVRKTHKYAQKVLSMEASHASGLRLGFYQHKLDEYAKQLSEQCRSSFPVCRVYVTFEHEEHQRLCLKEMEVPDINALLDLQDAKKTKKSFRDAVLDIVEPPEPDNIIWRNLEAKVCYRICRRLLSVSVALGMLVCTWYVIQFTKVVSPGFLAFVIGMIDSMLPTLFEALTDFALPTSEAAKQSTLQLRLFAARLLLSTVLPYIQTAWNKVLEPEFIQQIIIIQIAACFTAPLISVFDPAGFVKKNILARRADTQEEMNLKWTGSNWSLAEKYTGISKILFVSLYYSLLIPFSLFLCVPSFLLIFLADRYLLLRKWKQSPMMDEKVAIRLRQQAILAVAAHMFVSMRFIYSWPMDEAWDNHGVFQKVDKYPNFGVWGLNLQEWQSVGQKRIFYAYKICLFLTASVAVIVWIVIPGFVKLRKLFCYVVDMVGESQKIPFSTIKNIDIYEPMIQTDERNYLCSHTIDVLQKHRPSVLVPGPSDPVDLSYHIPVQHRPFVLSIVKYYETDSAVSVQKDNVHDYNSMFNAILRDEGTKNSGGGGGGNYEMVLQDDAPYSLSTLPPAPPMPVDLFAKIRGRPVTREESKSDAELPTAVQRVRSLQADRSNALVGERREFRVPRDPRAASARITPTPGAAPRKANHRYERRDVEDDDLV